MRSLTRFVPVAVVLALGELVARAGWVNPNVFPPVTEIALRWFAIVIDGRVLGPLWATLWVR